MNQLSKRMYYYLKNNISPNIAKKFYQLKNEIFKKNGFYVNAPQTNYKSSKQIKRIVN